ncbi:tagatose 6-phosphate kinase [Streptomyces sp. B4I13]|uniref:1-phosphofructokinase family hexose kinase n=1 Tax=Streptomyces sp. B4I13 TaxID=3042271 RepID=UPI002785D2B2|nr:1-phosphofructokinase family hexose kinase [Streptomyces sp. B4I13]MDQ0960956.1 tagatose 6-phosphate kinase [Streptomyces sp. B4I13]
MILTVTLNTALDVTYRVPALVPHASHGVTDVRERPGGKGLNVARLLAALGHETTVTGFAGGTTGRILRDLLTGTAGAAAAGVPDAGVADALVPDAGVADALVPVAGVADALVPVAGVADALVPVAGATRRTVAVVDGRTGDTTRFEEPGPVVTPAEWSAFREVYEGLLAGADAVALCGSLPPGVPVGAYAGLIRAARAAGVPVLLDTGGEPLRRGVAARPDVVQPNADELAELTGSHEPSRATRDARRRGAHAVVASLGAQGLLAATPQGDWRAVPPARLRGNPADAGDAVVAGLLSGLVEQLPWPVRLARAVALSTATVTAPTAGDFDRRTYEELTTRVSVTDEGRVA